MEVDGLEMKQAEAEGRSVVMNEGECSRSAGEREKKHAARFQHLEIISLIQLKDLKH